MVPPSLLAGVVTPPLLAHQGGWDEILMVAVPVGLFAFLLYAANKRAARLAEGRAADETVDAGPPAQDPPSPWPRGPV